MTAFLVLGAVMLAASSALVAAALRLPPLSFLLGAYILVAAQVVSLVFVLSPLRLVDAGGLLAGQAVLLAAAGAVWAGAGRPRPPLPRVRVREEARRHPVVAALAAVVALGFAYALVIGLVAPPNNSDSMTYRLSRAVEWLQHGGLHWIPSPPSQRWNEFPPNSELEQLYTLALLGGDAAVALPQLVAGLALVAAVAGAARRLGYSVAAAAFAGLLVATLTEVALQSTSSQNDLVTASFVAAAAYFLRSPRLAELALGGAAVGLALGTKLSAWFALPVLGLIALVSLPHRRYATAAAALLLGTIAFAGPFLALNLAHTEKAFGHAAEQQGFRPDVTPLGTVSTVARVVYQFVDLSGFRVRTSWLEPVERAGEAVFDALRIPPNPAESAAFPFTFEINVTVHEDYSFFGPLGILLIVPLALVFAAAWPLRRTTAARAAHGLALPLFLLVLALTFRFSNEGRYLVVPVALVAPLAASVYRYRLVAGVAAVLGALTLGFAHGYNELKPTGLGTRDPVWRLPHAEATALDVPERAALIAAVEQTVPPQARVGVALDASDWSYPLYGSGLDRTLVPLPRRGVLEEAERRGLETVVLGAAWQVERRGWTIERFEDAGTLALRD